MLFQMGHKKQPHLDLQTLKVPNFRIVAGFVYPKSLSGNRITSNCFYSDSRNR